MFRTSKRLSVYAIIHLIITGIFIITLAFFAHELDTEANGQPNFPKPYHIYVFVWLAGLALSFFKKTVVLGLILSVAPVIFMILF